MYIWEEQDWPEFKWDSARLIDPVGRAMFGLGEFQAVMRSLGFDAQLRVELKAMSADVIKTSAIEGETFSPESVRSSIARRLGLPDGGIRPTDYQIEGVVEVMLDVTRKFDKPLTEERLFGWHAALFPTGYSKMHKIDVGKWRQDSDGPMQVVSGSMGREKVHFEAPPARRLDYEMMRFLKWFNEDSVGMNGIFRAAVAHLWFVTLHPLDDGNGRTARAVADLAIAQMEGTGQRFYSMSSQIEREKRTYYDLLEKTQKGYMDITEWMDWFTQCYHRAILEAGKVTKLAVEKARFVAEFDMDTLSARQAKIVKRLLDGFEGNLNTSRYANMAGCSQDTAARDIADLENKGILVKNPVGGKKTSYSLKATGPQPHTPETALDPSTAPSPT
jgi:Fic family protein